MTKAPSCDSVSASYTPFFEQAAGICVVKFDDENMFVVLYLKAKDFKISMDLESMGCKVKQEALK